MVPSFHFGFGAKVISTVKEDNFELRNIQTHHDWFSRGENMRTVIQNRQNSGESDSYINLYVKFNK